MGRDQWKWKESTGRAKQAEAGKPKATASWAGTQNEDPKVLLVSFSSINKALKQGCRMARTEWSQE